MTDAEFAEVRAVYPAAHRFTEAGVDYVFLPGLILPVGCEPASTDLVIRPSPLGAYPAKLYFAEKPVRRDRPQPNWHDRITLLEREWHAYSYRYPGDGLTPLQHLVRQLEPLS